MKRNKTRLLFLVVLLALFGCRGPKTSGEDQTVNLAMGYIPNVQFAPFYVAVERGYFAEEGIEVKFDYGMETDLLKLVGTNELHFVVGSGDQVIMARSQDLPVVYVLNWYRRFPVTVAALEPLNAPQDLAGKTVGIPGLYGASYIGWQTMLSGAGVDPAAVNLVSIGYTQVESLIEGQVDAAVVYAMNAPVQLAQQGHEVSQLFVDDYVDLISNGLISNEQTIKNNPELVRGMVRAVLRGIQDTLDDPEAAFEICLQYMPELDASSQPLQRAVLDASLDFWRPQEGLLGRSDPTAWQASVAAMREMGLIEREPDVGQLFSNDFVSEP